jgi:hypothetical protein
VAEQMVRDVLGTLAVEGATNELQGRASSREVGLSAIAARQACDDIAKRGGVRGTRQVQLRQLAIGDRLLTDLPDHDGGAGGERLDRDRRAVQEGHVGPGQERLERLAVDDPDAPGRR